LVEVGREMLEVGRNMYSFPADCYVLTVEKSDITDGHCRDGTGSEYLARDPN